MNDFAIVIPNFNQSHFLPTAFESLKAQDASFSVAVVDGGSNDDLQKIIDQYADIITYFRSHPDDGQSAAINEGRKEIAGNYITWLNADDYYFPQTLAFVKKIFERHPDIDIIYGDAIHVDPDGNFISYFPPIRDFCHDELTHNCFICQPACFMRSEAFDNVRGVNPNLDYTMDWDLWCRLARQNHKFMYIPKPLAAVRYYPETKTVGGNYKRLLEIYRIEKKYGTRLIKWSWLGSYYYGLGFKNRNRYETLLYHALKCLHRTKCFVEKRWGQNRNEDLLYGFQRWQAVIETKCEIHLPWFNPKPWQRLHLRMDPPASSNTYQIAVDGIRYEGRNQENNCLTVDLKAPAGNYACIAIESQNHRQWKLKAFKVQ